MKRVGLLLLLLTTLSCTQSTPIAAPENSSTILPSSMLLPIPNRLQDADAPPEGWCGEASIQMGLSFYNKEASQKEIHAAGKPSHPDLYSSDINRALEAFGLNYIEWNDNVKNLPKFIAWIKSNIAKGYPVFCGMKINPTRHPEWSLDHFVIAVGYNENGLYINTNHKDGQLLITYEQLASDTNHYSFENVYHRYFGRALTGFKPSFQ